MTATASIRKREFSSAELEFFILMNDYRPAPPPCARSKPPPYELQKRPRSCSATPAAISHQIHALEQELGVRLFHRLNRSIGRLRRGACRRGVVLGLRRDRSRLRRLRAHNDTGAHGDGIALVCRSTSHFAANEGDAVTVRLPVSLCARSRLTEERIPAKASDNPGNSTRPDAVNSIDRLSR